MRDGGEQREKHYQELKLWLMDSYVEYRKTKLLFR